MIGIIRFCDFRMLLSTTEATRFIAERTNSSMLHNLTFLLRIVPSLGVLPAEETTDEVLCGQYIIIVRFLNSEDRVLLMYTQASVCRFILFRTWNPEALNNVWVPSLMFLHSQMFLRSVCAIRDFQMKKQSFGSCGRRGIEGYSKGLHMIMIDVQNLL